MFNPVWDTGVRPRGEFILLKGLEKTGQELGFETWIEVF